MYIILLLIFLNIVLISCKLVIASPNVVFESRHREIFSRKYFGVMQKDWSNRLNQGLLRGLDSILTRIRSHEIRQYGLRGKNL